MILVFKGICPVPLSLFIVVEASSWKHRRRGYMLSSRRGYMLGFPVETSFIYIHRLVYNTTLSVAMVRY